MKRLHNRRHSSKVLTIRQAAMLPPMFLVYFPISDVGTRLVDPSAAVFDSAYFMTNGV
jgi:hypothetical protein